MSRRVLSIVVLCGVVVAVVLSIALRPRSAPAAVKSAPVVPALPPAPASTPAQAKPSRYSLLPALRFENQTTHELVEAKLYDKFGNIDEIAAARLDSVLCDGRDPKHPKSTRINRRTL